MKPTAPKFLKPTSKNVASLHPLLQQYVGARPLLDALPKQPAVMTSEQSTTQRLLECIEIMNQHVPATVPTDAAPVAHVPIATAPALRPVLHEAARVATQPVAQQTAGVPTQTFVPEAAGVPAPAAGPALPPLPREGAPKAISAARARVLARVAKMKEAEEKAKAAAGLIHDGAPVMNPVSSAHPAKAPVSKPVEAAPPAKTPVSNPSSATQASKQVSVAPPAKTPVSNPSSETQVSDSVWDRSAKRRRLEGLEDIPEAYSLNSKYPGDWPLAKQDTASPKSHVQPVAKDGKPEKLTVSECLSQQRSGIIEALSDEAL